MENNEITKIYLVKDLCGNKPEKTIAVCTSKQHVETIILDVLREKYPFADNLNIFELEEIENNRLRYRNNCMKVITIDKLNTKLDWRD